MRTKQVLALGALAGVLAAPALATPVLAAPEQVEKQAVSAAEVAPIAATFNVVVGFTSYGQNVYVVGSIPELGSWNPANAVPLTTTSSTFPTWTGGVALPANTYAEFQYIVKNPDGTVARWEKGYRQNRSTITPPTGTYITHDTFGGY
ncbi:CBM20 domain-containing protein [Actinoplanes sp. NPDC023936]|uniref:CBM20 domain-containing protein n=1 Tax=Actinoplanes sp. NPDC023936 TaxID=3154910 RepID=UPI003400BF9A